MYAYYVLSVQLQGCFTWHTDHVNRQYTVVNYNIASYDDAARVHILSCQYKYRGYLLNLAFYVTE